MPIGYTGSGEHDSVTNQCVISYSSSVGGTLFVISSGVVTSMNDSANNSYTQISNTINSVFAGFNVYYCVNATPITNLIFNTSNTGSSAMLGEYSGIGSVTGAAVQGTGSSTTPNISTSLTNSNNWFIGFVGNVTSGTNTISSDFGNLRVFENTVETGNSAPYGNGTFGLVDNTGSGSVELAVNVNTSHEWGMLGIEFVVVTSATVSPSGVSFASAEHSPTRSAGAKASPTGVTFASAEHSPTRSAGAKASPSGVTFASAEHSPSPSAGVKTAPNGVRVLTHVGVPTIAINYGGSLAHYGWGFS